MYDCVQVSMTYVIDGSRSGIDLPVNNNYLLTFSVFYHLGGVDVSHHDSPAFSVSGHLWVDAIDAHVTFSLSSHLIFGRPLGRVPVTVILNVLLVMWVSSLRITCSYHDSRFLGQD